MRKRIKAFGHALAGGRKLIASQTHAKIHAVATVVVVGAAVYSNVNRLEWVALIVCVISVWVAEALNTAVEFLSDEVSLEWRERIKHAKDVAAFGVLAASVCSAIVGLIVFWPYWTAG